MVFNTNGLGHVAKVFAGEEVTNVPLRYFQPGTDGSAPLASQNDLRAPLGTRKFFSLAFATGAIATIRFEILASDTAYNGTWREWIIAWTSSGGDILILDIFATAIVKDSSTSEIIDIDITFADGG